MKIKVDIFSGFLGAGKTLLIKKFLNEKLAHENIVIIENEFGQVGIDGSILKKNNINVKEINSGCICCSIAGDFKYAINEIITEYKPSRIIIEPSGVAKLSEVLNVFKEANMKTQTNINMIITVVDVERYDLYIENFNDFYSDQIKNARTIVLSRTQNCTENKVLQVVNSIKKLNDKAKIVTTPWNEVHAEKIIEAAEKDVQEELNKRVNLVRRSVTNTVIRSEKGYNTSHSTNELFQTFGYETPKQFNTDELENIVKRFKDEKSFGKVIRAKGIVQKTDKTWIQFDYVPGEFVTRETTADYASRLCIIGSQLNKDQLNKLFQV